MIERDLTALIDPMVVEIYMLGHGWTAPRRTQAFSVWTRDDLKDVALFLPLSSRPDDYEERLAAFVARLAVIEGLDHSVLVTNLRYAASDLVRVRLMSPRVGPGEVPITDGAKLFDGTRELMQAAACAAVQPRPTYGSKKPGTVVDYLNALRLGQTERGSYVVTVISDVEPDEQTPLLPDDAAHLQVPFERRVTSQLVIALDAARVSAERVLSGEDVSVFEAAVDQGVSANLCDAVQKMGEESQASSLHITVDWALSRRPTVPERQVTVQPEIMPVLSAASRSLKKLGPFEDVEVIGIVGVLDRGANDEVGTIVVEGSAMDARRNVRIELSDAQYHRAVEAHDSKRTVSVRGTLVKEGKYWLLIDPQPLRIEA